VGAAATPAARELYSGLRFLLEALVAEASDLDFANTRRLVEHRERVRATIRLRLHSAAD